MTSQISFISLFAAFVNLFIFSYVYSQHKNERVNRTFLIFSFVTFTVCTIDYLIQHPANSFQFQLFSKAGMIFFLCSGIAYLDFTYAVIRKQRDPVLYGCFGICILFIVASLFVNHHQMSPGLQPGSTGTLVTPTTASIPFFLSVFIPSTYSFFLLLNRFIKKSPSSNLRKQIDLLFWSMVAASLFYPMLLVVMPMLIRSFLPQRLVALGAVIHVPFVFRAIRKYKFMTVDDSEFRAVSEVLFRDNHDAIIMTDIRGTLIQHNTQAERLLGNSIKRDRPLSVETLFPGYSPDENKNRIFEIHNNRHSLYVNISQSTILNGADPLGKLIIIRDITDQRKYEEALNRKSRLESLGQLAGGISHDYNNQLAGILGCAEIIRLSHPDNNENYELADMIIKAARRSSELTSKLLAFARKGKYQIEPVNLHIIIHEILSILKRSIDKKIVLQPDLEAHSPIVKGDSGQLYHVLLNLALNSRDAISESGTIRFLTRNVTLDENDCLNSTFDITSGPYISLSVIDSGCGMNQETQNHMFEPFFTTKPKNMGTGMGLAAVYGTICNHHGSITVESAPGKGTTVTFLLPCSNADSLQQDNTVIENVSPSPKRVMVIDDEPVVTLFARRGLEKIGHIPIVFNESPKAVEHYRQHWSSIDVVFLDLIMPLMNGYETFVAFKEINPDVKITVFSGYEKDGTVQKMVEAGASFMHKPFSMEQLRKAVEEAGTR